MTKLKLLILFALIGMSVFAFGQRAEAAIIVTATSTSGTMTNVNNWTFAHTVAESDSFAVVAVKGYTNVTGVTFNGVTMTKSTYSVTAGWGYRSYIYTLVNPTTGNIVVTFATNSYGQAMAYTMSGVATSTPIDAIATSTMNVRTATPSTTISTNYANSFLFDILGISYNESGIVGLPQIEFEYNFFTSSRRPTTAAGSYKMSWNSVTEPASPINTSVIAIREVPSAVKRRIFISYESLKSLKTLVENSLFKNLL